MSLRCLRWLRFVRLCGAAIACLLFAAQAIAHASLLSTSPADGATLAAAPAGLTLTFDEPVTPLVLTLVGGNGHAVALPSEPEAVGASIRIALPDGLRDGSYLLSYRVASVDSHPVAGTIGFSIGSMSRPAALPIAAQATSSEGSRIAVRALRDIALLIAVGGALFVLAVARFAGDRRVLTLAGAVAALAALLGVGVQGVALLGAGRVLMPNAWDVAWHTSFGLSAGLAATAALLIVIGAQFLQGQSVEARLQMRKSITANRLETDSVEAKSIEVKGMDRRTGHWLMLAGALMAAASLPLTGHAAASPYAFYAMPAIAVHALAAAFWFGSLVGLFVLLGRREPNALPALQVFSRIAMVAVALLVAAGASFAVLQLGSWQHLVATRYGQLVLLKISLLLVLLLLAARNRFMLMPRLEGVAMPGEALAANASLRRAIVVEFALLAVVIGATAVLTQTSPHPASIERRASAGQNVAIVSVAPGRAGPNLIEVRLLDGSGRPLDAAALELALASVQHRIEPIVREPLRID